jgi:TPR repeat protein
VRSIREERGARFTERLTVSNGSARLPLGPWRRDRGGFMRIWRHVCIAVAAAAVLAESPAMAQAQHEVEAAEAAVAQITPQEWLSTPSVDLVARVVEASSPEALREVGDNGNPEAQALVGSAFENGVAGFAVNEAAAVRYYERAASAGNVLAQYNVGGMYLDGRGIDQNFERALFWREQAAAQGDRMALSVLGFQYIAGFGVEQDFLLARGYLEAAVILGDAPALVLLGQMYEGGLGVTPDRRRAVDYFRRAADLGEPLGEEGLRRMGK